MNKNVVNMEDEIFRFSRFTDLMKVLTGMRIDFSAFCSSSACCIEIRVSQGTVCLMFNPSEDLEAIYNVVYPRYSVLWTRDLELEVSSPGINRNIKDIGEFKIFLGKTVRVYVQSKSSYVVGKIEKADDDYLYLSSYLIEDTKEEGEEISIEYSDISKAKLDYVTEAKGK